MTENNETGEREEGKSKLREEEMRKSQAEGESKPQAEGKKIPQVAFVKGRRSLEWKCLTCGATALPTPGAYMGFIQHSCTGKRKIWLVDRDTGEQLANNASQALRLGLIEKSTPPPPRAPEELPERKLRAGLEEELAHDLTDLKT